MSIKSTSKLADRCNVAYAVDMIGGKWKISIIWELACHGQSRLSTLRRQLTGISEGVLISQLRELEAHGLVQRINFKEVPPHVEYTLTARGRRLIAIIEKLDRWGADCRTEEAPTQSGNTAANAAQDKV